MKDENASNKRNKRRRRKQNERFSKAKRKKKTYIAAGKEEIGTEVKKKAIKMEGKVEEDYKRINRETGFNTDS